MIKDIKERLMQTGIFPWLGLAAAAVIIVFGVIAFAGAQRTTPNTGSDTGPLALSSGSASPPSSPSAASPNASPSATPRATALPTVARSVAPTPVPGPAMTRGVVLLDAQQTGNWQSQTFTAPSTWTISYTYDCGGGGRFTVAAFSDTMQETPIDKIGTRGSGTATIRGGGKGVYLATNTACSWHLTARAA